MSWIQHFFGKEAAELEVQDVQAFFKTERRESQRLEFKSGQVSLDKILKVIGGFLNAEGGLLIIGAPRENQSDSDIFEHQEGLDPSRDLTAEQLRSGMQRGIQPPPESVHITEIALGEGVLLLVDIPKSNYPPHQVFRSGTYYIRQDDATRPARHREVERLFMEARRPRLDLQVQLGREDDAIDFTLDLRCMGQISARQPGVLLEAWPVRKNDEQRHFQQQYRWPDLYLAEGQAVQQHVAIWPSATVLFFKAHYFALDLTPAFKAAFVDVGHRKAGLREVFDSKQHSDFQLWYDQYSYLLNEH